MSVSQGAVEHLSAPGGPGFEQPLGWQPMYRDPSLPHQIQLHFLSGDGSIAVACNCQTGTGSSLGTIRSGEDPQPLYRRHLETL